MGLVSAISLTAIILFALCAVCYGAPVSVATGGIAEVGEEAGVRVGTKTNANGMRIPATNAAASKSGTTLSGKQQAGTTPAGAGGKVSGEIPEATGITLETPGAAGTVGKASGVTPGATAAVVNSVVACKKDKVDKLTDVPAKAFLADFVFEGTAIDISRHANAAHSARLATGIVFEMKQAIKADNVKLSPIIGDVDLKVAHLNLTVFNFSSGGQGQGRSGSRCKTGVSLGQTYLVYASVRRLRHLDHVLMASAFPDATSKEVRRAAKSVLCNGCARVPRVTITPTTVTSAVGSRVKVECEVSALPAADVRWLIGDNILSRSEHISMKMTRKGSRLSLKNVTVADSATYTCQATNVVGQQLATVTLRVLEPTTPPPTSGDVTLSEDYARSRHKLACPVSQQDFCLHGGTCYQLKGLSNSIHCHCAPGYTGRRCEEERSIGYDLRAKTSDRGQDFKKSNFQLVDVAQTLQTASSTSDGNQPTV